ncbi:unnamed protein product [Trichobilharzia regenti]|nr:unnamed protein product [Trichobilharzia regenti]
MQKLSKRNSQSISDSNTNQEEEKEKLLHSEPLNKQPRLTILKQNLFNNNDTNHQQLKQQGEQLTVTDSSKTDDLENINANDETFLHDHRNYIKSKLNENDILDTLKSLLTCSVCLEIRDQTNQCPNGHLICSQCSIQLLQQSSQTNLAKCPSCRVNLQYKLRRCLLAEQMTAELPHECHYCFNIIPRRLIKQHEYELCPNRYVTCRYNLVGCVWKGKYEDLNSHISKCDYKQKTVEDVESNLVRNLIHYELYLMNEIQFSKTLSTKLNNYPMGLRIIQKQIAAFHNDSSDVNANSVNYQANNTTLLSNFKRLTVEIHINCELNKLDYSIKTKSNKTTDFLICLNSFKCGDILFNINDQLHSVHFDALNKQSSSYTTDVLMSNASPKLTNNANNDSSKNQHQYTFDDLSIDVYRDQTMLDILSQNNCILLNFLLFVEYKDPLEIHLYGNQSVRLNEPLNVQMRFEHANGDHHTHVYNSPGSDSGITNENDNNNTTTTTTTVTPMTDVTVTTPQDQLRLGTWTRLLGLPTNSLLRPILGSLFSNNTSTTTTTTTSLSSTNRNRDTMNGNIDNLRNPIIVTLTRVSNGSIDDYGDDTIQQNSIITDNLMVRHLGLIRNEVDEEDNNDNEDDDEEEEEEGEEEEAEEEEEEEDTSTAAEDDDDDDEEEENDNEGDEDEEASNNATGENDDFDNEIDISNQTLEKNNNALTGFDDDGNNNNNINVDNHEESDCLTDNISSLPYESINTGQVVKQTKSEMELQNPNNISHVYNNNNNNNNNRSNERINISVKRKRSRDKSINSKDIYCSNCKKQCPFDQMCISKTELVSRSNHLKNCSEKQLSEHLKRSNSLVNNPVKRRNMELDTNKTRWRNEGIRNRINYLLPVWLKNCVTLFSNFSRYFLRNHMITKESQLKKNRDNFIMDNSQNNATSDADSLQINEMQLSETSNFDIPINKSISDYYCKECYQVMSDTVDNSKCFYNSTEAKQTDGNPKLTDYQYPDHSQLLPTTSTSFPSGAKTIPTCITSSGVCPCKNVTSDVTSSFGESATYTYEVCDFNVSNPNVKIKRKYTRKPKVTVVKSQRYKSRFIRRA